MGRIHVSEWPAADDRLSLSVAIWPAHRIVSLLLSIYGAWRLFFPHGRIHPRIGINAVVGIDGTNNNACGSEGKTERWPPLKYG